MSISPIWICLSFKVNPHKELFPALQFLKSETLNSSHNSEEANSTCATSIHQIYDTLGSSGAEVTTTHTPLGVSRSYRHFRRGSFKCYSFHIIKLFLRGAAVRDQPV